MLFENFEGICRLFAKTIVNLHATARDTSTLFYVNYCVTIRLACGKTGTAATRYMLLGCFEEWKTVFVLCKCPNKHISTGNLINANG